MNKFLIIDDRAERKKGLMREKDLKTFEEYKDDGFLCELTSLPFNSNSSYDELNSFFADYSVIAIHRSLMQTKNVINIIDEYFRNSNKLFIVFSGGTDVNDCPYNAKRLSINASIFYSSKLIYFVKRLKREDKLPSLLELLYGESWRLPLLLEYRNILWRNNEEADFEEKEELRRAIEPTLNTQWNDDTILDIINKEIAKEKLKYLVI